MRSTSAGFTLVEAVVALTVLMLLVGIVMGSISNMYRATTFSDNTLLVNTENSRAMAAMREDLLQTSRNFSGNYAPFTDAGTSEVRFRKINGFSISSGRATYENRYTCYYLDSASNTLYRRYRDLSGSLLTSPPREVLGQHVTSFTPSIDTNTKTVTITLTTLRGETARNEQATITRSVVVTPFNID